ncbi:MAG: SDR family oxidoreductase [Clostridiales bacterium]|nr:SDR family oxidoreductase [Clostridiales bacterium]
MNTPSISTMKGAFDLSGKNTIVTGGNGGLGFGVSKAFAESGANVAVLCRDMGKAAGALKELGANGGKYEAFSCDVTDMADVRKAVGEAYKSFGNIDILVNNAGVSTNTRLFDMDEELTEWHRVVDTDLTGLVNMTYVVGKRMRDSDKGGNIINVTSNAGLIINRDLFLSPYSAAKAAANHFTRSMAMELGLYGIRVNAIAPGFINDGFGKNSSPERDKQIFAAQALDRRGTAMEVGALAVYLASAASGFTTGAVMVMDGGYSLSC